MAASKPHPKVKTMKRGWKENEKVVISNDVEIDPPTDQNALRQKTGIILKVRLGKFNSISFPLNNHTTLV